MNKDMCVACDDGILNIRVGAIIMKDGKLLMVGNDRDYLYSVGGRVKFGETAEEYKKLKALALKSAQDFLALYDSVPDKHATAAPERKTFYGKVPRSADEMYAHTKNVNEYYFSEIHVDADNDGSIYACRKRGFEALEAKGDFLENVVVAGSYGEDWSLRKVLRRFIWHDRIHAKAMYRMATKVFGVESIVNPFYFFDEGFLT